MQPQNRDNVTDFLVADLEHFGESLWRNEEIGEKRFNFFLGLVTAVIGGLVVLHTAEGRPPVEMREKVTNGAFTGLFVLGILTYLRMLHRNRVTDQYQQTLKNIRDKMHGPNHSMPQPLEAGIWRWFRGGLAEMVGALDAILLCALLLFNSVGIFCASVISLLILIMFWVLAAPRKGVQ